MVQRLTSEAKRRIGEDIIARRLSVSLASITHQKSPRTARRYAWMVRKGIPIYAGRGRPRTLDDEHFLQLVDFARSLAPENRAENSLLYEMYRELAQASLIKRCRDVNEQFDPAGVEAKKHSRRTWKRYCVLAVASI